MTHARAWLACFSISRGVRAGGWLALAALALAVAFAAAVTPAAAETRFVFANESPYDTMDPHAAFDVGRVAVRLNLYDGLYRWLDNPAVLTPWLAESHTVSADGLTYTFKLRRGAKFHDGAEVTAEDVRYSMERILALKKGAASLLSTMVAPGTTKAVDRYTVQFALAKPAAFGRWTQLTLAGDEYQQFGRLSAWRVTLWDGDTLLGEQASFLWANVGAGVEKR